MLQTYLIDDEPQSLQTLSSLIEVSLPDVDVTAQFTDPEKGLQAIKEKQPDVVLLDIDMPGLTGFELLKKLPEIKFEVIFVTAYNEFALNAIKLSAIDYLLKPVDPDELVEAIKKAQKSINQKKIADQLRVLEELLKKDLNIRKRQENNIVLPFKNGLEYVKMSNIIWVQADKNYCKFYFKEGNSLLISKNIGTYELSLDAYELMRIHRSHIANLYFVKRFLIQDGSHWVEMKNGKLLEVSKNNIEKLKRRLARL